MLISVFGATGNTGKEVCRALSSIKNVRIRAVTRESQRASTLPVHEVHETEWTDRSGLRRALEGAAAAYFMLPTGLHDGSLYAFRDAYSREFLAAAAETGVRRILFLSSFGAHLADRSGVLRGLCRAEENLEAFRGELTTIRPGYFFQNFSGNVAGIRENGFFGGYPVDPDVKLLYSDTADIGTVAAGLLTGPSVPDHEVRYVGHPQLATFREISIAIGEKSGRTNLMWTNVGSARAREFMLSRNMPADIVDNLIEFFEAINSGRAMDDYTPDRLIPTAIGKDEFTSWFAGQIAS